jgi:hypothetical protein
MGAAKDEEGGGGKQGYQASGGADGLVRQGRGDEPGAGCPLEPVGGKDSAGGFGIGIRWGRRGGLE